MDYATHGDLYTLWLLEGAFSEAAVRLYIAELALVVDFLHNAGIVFRDLKVGHVFNVGCSMHAATIQLHVHDSLLISCHFVYVSTSRVPLLMHVHVLVIHIFG